MLDFVEERDEMPEVAAEPIERGDGDEIELPSANLDHEGIETGTFLPCPADGVIGEVSNHCPAGAIGMFAQRAELVLGRLIAGADASVENDAWARR